MKRAGWRLLWVLACAGTGWAQDTAETQNMTLSTTGITIGAPKVYDNYYLQASLARLRDQLGGLQVVDQSTLLSHIGQAQGGTLSQVGVAFQGTGATPPTMSTVTGATPGTTTTTNPVAAVNPAPAATTLALPTIGQSSLDTLNESMQLSSQIIGYQLLLNGSLTDLQTPRGKLRTIFTIGFPVTINPPRDEVRRKLENSLVEVHVTICGASNPSIATLIPQERTYNVASIVDHSVAASVGSVLGGVFSIGGGFLWHHQSYFLVQQQETVALQEPAGSCSMAGGTPVSFVWQIHPVLGKKFVRPGMQMNFVQMSIDNDYIIRLARGETLAQACVLIDWRKTEDHGNRLRPDLIDKNSGCFPIKRYESAPTVWDLMVSDIGGGNVQVTARGAFLPGTGIRIGNSVLPAGAVRISPNGESLTFSATAADIATAGGASFINRDEGETAIVKPLLPPPPPPPPPADASKAPPPPPPPTPLTIISPVQVAPFSDSLSLVTVDFVKPVGATLPLEPCSPLGAANPPHCIPTDPYLIRLGTKVFGLANAPFLVSDVTHIQFLAPSDAIAGATELELFRLLWFPQFYYDHWPLNKDAVTVGKPTLLASAPAVMFSIAGTNLDNALMVNPACGTCYAPTGTSFATITLITGDKGTKLDAAGIKALKQVILCKKGSGGAPCDDKFLPVVVPVPTDSSDSKAAKTSLEKVDPIKPGTPQITIKGTALDQIATIRISGALVAYHLTQDKQPALVITLPSSVSATVGQYPLWIELVDKTTMSSVINVGIPNP